MAPAKVSRRLIVNADDFGRSSAINKAIIRAHREGILTTTSLMVNGTAFDEAVELAHGNPRLGVGLHLTLLCGSATLSSTRIPGLVTEDGRFSDNPVRTGMRYFFNGSLIPQLRDEIGAQFSKFRNTMLNLDHVNGHLNLHLHPVVFRLLMEGAEEWGIRTLRVTHDPLWLNLRLAQGQLIYRLSHALIFGCLSRRAEVILARKSIRYTARVFGLLQTGRVDRDYLLKLLPRLPPGDSELYSHPCLDNFVAEFDALINPTVRQSVRDNQIELIRYADL